MNVGPGSRARMWIGLAVLGVLCALAARTMDPGSLRLAVLLLLGFFAVRIVLAGLASR